MLERLLRRSGTYSRSGNTSVGSARPRGDDPVPAAYKPWIIVSVAVLALSFLLGAVAVVAAFVSFNQQKTPLWVIALGALSILGVVAGFAGLFFMLATAGFRSWKDSRRIQVLPPE